ncbi:uncharacterized protein LAESUDRAFT_235657 [Laetiporus sulphureus 93-53]|uniref:Amidohydrolase 3 domain-containing protein n=1 Tax=Laetiporus sulphureus 93-53 TaxID=1314785 RepID=A0A165DN04_9APHY|nr:uncharacterized protein LAESUDRAFT_235657 [Laetiporus sulphureus 93-53]KZT05240.1 hypothetical protein LAESUDRAFT_235657 [Laetiporus sulphureus 93-53]
MPRPRRRMKAPQHNQQANSPAPSPTARPSPPRPTGPRVWQPKNKRTYTLKVLVASIVAGFVTYYSRLAGIGKSTSTSDVLTTVPDSYALCAEEGRVYTVDEQNPSVDCLLVVKDRLLATGTIDDIRTHWDGHQTRLVNTFYGGEPQAKKPLTVLHTPKGSIIVPGLADAHAHLTMYGAKMELNLEDATSMDDVLDRLEAYARAHPVNFTSDEEEAWIEGFGWDQTRWKGWRGAFPSKTDLASRPLLAHRALSLSRVDGHALWVSPRALDIAERSGKLPGGRWPRAGEMQGGEVVWEDGEVSGVFLDAAMALVPVPPPTEATLEERAERAMRDALRVGLTSVHDAAVDGSMWRMFKRMADEGRMPIRVYAMAHEELDGYWGGEFERVDGYGREGRLTMRSVKLFMDGALGSWGAALLEPYADKPDTQGIMRLEESELRDVVRKFWDDGWGVNIHCIGDRANKAVLDIYEELLAGNASEAEARRPRIEHAQIMRAEDLERTGRLGVIASVQPTHATSDMGYAETRLGPERIKGAYAYQTLLRSSRNGVLPLGSDFPVEGINPLLGFYAAVSRLDRSGESPHGSGGWYPQERLTRAQALKGMTLDAAYASFAENAVGSLSAGKKADYVVLDTDVMREDAPYAEILKTKVLTTVVDGRIAYGAI